MHPDLTISAFSRRCGISISALRFYDQCGVLTPASVDGSSGYRFYDEAQVAEATLLRDLRRLDFSLDQIRGFQRADTAAREQFVSEQLTVLQGRLHETHTIARSLLDRLQREGITLSDTQIQAELLGEALEQVLFAASRDTKKDAALSCVLIEAREGSLRVVATDRHRLAVRDLATTTSEAFRAVVPLDDAAALRDWLRQDGPAALELDDSGLSVRTSDGDRSVPVTDGAFPPYERLFIAEPEGHRLVTSRSAVIEALEPFLALDYVDVELTTGSLRFADDEGPVLSADYDGPALNLAVRPQYAHDAVHASVGPDIVVDVTSPVHPVVFRSADEGSYTCMVMPVRVGPGARQA